MRLVMAVLQASLWLLVIARWFDRATVEGAMVIAGFALLGLGPVTWLVHRRFWRASVIVGVVCLVILPGAWWSLRIDLPASQPIGGRDSLLSDAARWLVPMADTHIPEGPGLYVARVIWYGTFSLGALLYLSAPFMAPTVSLLWCLVCFFRRSAVPGLAGNAK